MRKNFSVKTIRAGLKRANGKCEGCGQPFSAANPPEGDHDKEDWEGGDNSLENLKMLGKKCCHVKKTAAATTRRKKADRVKSKNVENIKPRSRLSTPKVERPVMAKETGSKGHDAWKARMALKGKQVL